MALFHAPSPQILMIVYWQMECRDWETRQQSSYLWVVKLLIFSSMTMLSKKKNKKQIGGMLSP